MVRQENSPSENPVLSEGEKLMLDLFKQIPENKQEMVLEMIRAALKTLK
jgi:hypothetical protein